MHYHHLEESVYQNSRYELIQLLEDIYPTEHGKFDKMETFNFVAAHYEQLLNEHFVQLPLSEERLAIFSHVYSQQGFMLEILVQAVNSGNRVVIFLTLKGDNVDENKQALNSQKRRFYEAEFFNE